jgi:hypothetical protein
MAPWLQQVEMQVYVARYCHQTREEIRAMPLSTFFAWYFAVSDIVRRETSTND